MGGEQESPTTGNSDSWGHPAAGAEDTFFCHERLRRRLQNASVPADEACIWLNYDVPLAESGAHRDSWDETVYIYLRFLK